MKKNTVLKRKTLLSLQILNLTKNSHTSEEVIVHSLVLSLINIFTYSKHLSQLWTMQITVMRGKIYVYLFFQKAYLDI